MGQVADGNKITEVIVPR